MLETPAFYLGAHMAGWLNHFGAPLFVSHRRLRDYRTLPRAADRWALDSGAFTEVDQFGEFQTSPHEYVAAITRYADEVGQLDWASPQDHMCEPWVLGRSKTASTVEAAQEWTIRSVLTLRHLGPPVNVIPVLQGQTPDDYRRHVDAYARAGIDVHTEPTVGLGSVCRRQNTDDIGRVVAALPGVRLHGFGVKAQGLRRYGWMLASADSMAWSYGGRQIKPCPMRAVSSCANCEHHARSWRDDVLSAIRAPGRGVQLSAFDGVFA